MCDYLGKILPVAEDHICKECSCVFTAYYSQSFICGKCQRKAEAAKLKERKLELKRQRQTKDDKVASGPEKTVDNHPSCEDNKTAGPPFHSEYEEFDVPNEIELEPTRHCHDCGAKTSNFRCDKCLRKWRKKNGVQAENK